MRPKSTNYKAALYMRLSKDDDGAAESASITSQRKMLISFAKENDFSIYDEYVDDGWSGTNFERPNFMRMIDDIEAKKVNLVITKDLSRLGRDYITSGQYTELYFPSKGVRYIAINDGYDSESPYTDIAPFKNIINEMYARDTSKKIRSSFVTSMREGEFIGNFAPYGYRKDPLDKHHLIPNEETASIVQKIFELSAEGLKPIDIVRYLNEHKIVTPAVYRSLQHNTTLGAQYGAGNGWTTSSVTKILKNIVYLGHMAQCKTTKVSFKSKITVSNPKQDWIIIEHTHEPLVSQELFDLAQKRMSSRACKPRGKFCNIFSGIAKCADCGRSMSTVGTRKKGSPAQLACGKYKLYASKSGCTNHFIDYNVLYDIVLKAIQQQARLSESEQKELIRNLQDKIKQQGSGAERKRQLNHLYSRNRELDHIIEKLYEDNMQGRLRQDRFHKLLEKYELEGQQISNKIEELEEYPRQEEQIAALQNAYDKLRVLVERYTNIQELTPDLLFQLIERINIHQGYYEKTEQGRIKRQKIEIYFRFMTEAQTLEYVV